MNVREAMGKLNSIRVIRNDLDEICEGEHSYLVDDGWIACEGPANNVPRVCIKDIIDRLDELAYLIEEMKVTK